MWDTIDCETYDVSSSQTSCDVVDLCCDDLDCWYQTDSGRTDSADSVLDEICTFSWQTPLMFASFDLGSGLSWSPYDTGTMFL